ncbi:MAG TPA: RsmB/NOP family class I SAM-dependent RNA methyltransferase [Caulobacteraceae bacterium]|nr:RsmB/NOP family class I SAM-dependent RNA methyltransferase [Caulobacteraceae bacterium]
MIDKAASANPRLAALRLVQSALARRGGLDDALSTPALLGMTAQDRAFARAVAMTALRRLGQIDRVLDARLRKEPPEPVRDLLRIGLAQAFWLDTPDFAAVDTTVALAAAPLRGLVNAVMRGAVRDGRPPDDPQNLAPPWLLARWIAAYGEEEAGAIAGQIPLEPATDLTLRDPADHAAAELLEAEALPGGSLRLRRRGDVAEWPGYAEGRWWVQDAAAALPARLLRVRPDETAADLCAAPGGKTLQLAAAGARVTALDKSAGRLRRVKTGLERTGLSAETVVADAADWNDARQFDAVLLDAPCSASGTFRRHPDALWNARPGDIAALAALQARLLSTAARRVLPGGRLVYSVCSLEPEEGEGQVRAFLAANPDFALDPAAPGEAGAPAASLAPEGWLRILPHHLDNGIDGFFIARLRRAQ